MKKNTFLLCFLLFGLMHFQCKKVEMPIGVFPENKATISKKNAAKTVFSWPPMKFRDGRGFSYRLQVFEIDSIARVKDRKKYFFKTILDEKVETTFLKYPKKSPAFKEGEIYAWEVKTVDEFGQEHVIKELTSFSIREPKLEMAAERTETNQNPDLTGFCLSKRFFFEGDSCWWHTFDLPCQDENTIHMATGSGSIVPPPGTPNARMADLGATFNYNDNCFELNDGKVLFSSKYKITVPDELFDNIESEEQVVLKVFEDMVALPEEEIDFHFSSLSELGGETEGDSYFALTTDDYELVCIDEESYRQALIFMEFSFKMKTKGLYSFLKNYEIVLDLIPSGSHVHDDGSETSHDTNLGPLPIPCENLVYGSYLYYLCQDRHEDHPNGHQGKHIIRIPIDPSVFCGFWNLEKAVPISVFETSYTQFR